jgi:hypothetical protein
MYSEIHYISDNLIKSSEVMRIIKIAILLLCLTNALAVNLFKKIMVEDADALCLDGTLGAYYAH